MLIKLLAFVVVSLPVVGAGCADSLILHPWRTPINAGRAERHEIRSTNGEIVEAWVSRSINESRREPDGYVLEFTGSGTRAEQIADYVADRWRPHAVEVWAINYPGFGGSSGEAKLKSIAPAALCAFDSLAKRSNGKPIFVCGNSLGGTPALYVASKRKVAGLIIQNPPPIKTMVWREGWWNLWLLAAPVAAQVPEELDAPTNARKVTAPAVFVTADCDTYVLPEFQKLTIDAYAGPMRRIHLKNKGHNDSINTPPEIREMADAIDWLWSSHATGK